MRMTIMGGSLDEVLLRGGGGLLLDKNQRKLSNIREGVEKEVSKKKFGLEDRRRSMLLRNAWRSLLFYIYIYIKYPYLPY